MQYSYDTTIKMDKLMMTWLGTVEVETKMRSKIVHTQT
jgi:hypothetical protein